MNTRVKSTAIIMALIVTLSAFTSLAATTAMAAATTPAAEAATSAVATTTPTVAATPTATPAVAGTSTPTVEAAPTATASATPKVVGAIATTITFFAMNTNQPVYSDILVFVALKAGSTGLVDKPMKMWVIKPNGTREDFRAYYTGNGGDYTGQFVGDTRGQYVCHAEFAGDSQYAASSGTFTVNVGITPTTTTITASNTNPFVGEPFSITVTLKSGSTPINGLVDMRCTENGVIVFADFIEVHGVYTFNHAFDSTGQRVFHVEFATNNQYLGSSDTETVNVQPFSTATTITASNTNPFVGEPFSITVTLSSGSTGLNRPVKIWHSEADGTRVEDGIHNTINGVYTFTQAFASKGQRIYHAEFAGGSQYRASSGIVTVNVQPFSTATTITASNTNPPVGQSVTFTVTLRAGTSLLNRPVKIWHTTNGVRYEDGTHATTNGVYAFTQAFSSTGQRVYHAEYDDVASPYGSSSGTVTVNVQ